jgi:hypothetical protein
MSGCDVAGARLGGRLTAPSAQQTSAQQGHPHERQPEHGRSDYSDYDKSLHTARFPVPSPVPGKAAGQLVRQKCNTMKVVSRLAEGPPSDAQDEAGRKRFAEEADALGALHRHVLLER